MRVQIVVQDEKGNFFEGEATLTKRGNKDTGVEPVVQSRHIENNVAIKAWFKKNSTVSKILELVNEGFFDNKRAIGDIIVQLQNKDYHYSSSDLTLPLRKIVRHGTLTKIKNKDEVKKGKGTWMYIKKV